MKNVTDFRYALVESDSMELDQQNAMLRELELPIAALVFFREEKSACDCED